MVQAAVATDRDLGTGYREVDAHLVELPLMVLLADRFDNDPAGHDVFMKTVEFFRLFTDFRLDGG
jgi:hypothetical protein